MEINPKGVNQEEEKSKLIGNAEKLLERIETEHKNTFLLFNKRFMMGKSGDGFYHINDDTDKLESMSYGNAVKILHPEIEWDYMDSNDYQGEWIMVGKDKDGIFYYKKGSYGSCSGCDWYQGINEKEQAIEYIKSMFIIDKIGDKIALIDYLYKEKANAWGALKGAIDKMLYYLEKKYP